MIAANTTVFTLLDQFAAARGTPIENSGIPRWIATEPGDRQILKDALMTKSVKISPTRALARFDYSADNIFLLVGFDQGVGSVWLSPTEVSAALLTAALSELRPKPVASPFAIKKVVDAQDQRDREYAGHSAEDIAPLFPLIRAFQGRNLALEESSRIFFDFILAETELSNNWIDETLARNLRQLIDLDLIGLPYMTVARSMLDFDPSSLFMALYRCLESLYAHTGANKLRASLGIAKPWEEVAAALETDLNWRPIEWQSLEGLVAMGANAELVQIRDAVKPAFPGTVSDDVAKAASDLLYKLRNSVVHYRPSHNSVDHNLVDWNALCGACTTLISYVYSEVFGSL